MNIKQIIKINKSIVILEKEPFGFINKSNLLFALGEFKYNKRLNFFNKLGILLFGISNGHPFIEGNKRTTFIVLDIILTSNKLNLRLPKKTIENYIVRIAKGNTSPKSIGLYINRNSYK